MLFLSRLNNMTKPRNQVPKYEDVEHHEDLAITLAPCDRYQFFKAEDRLKTFEGSHRIKLTICAHGYCYFRLRTEISSHGRLHYHGYVTIKNRLKFYLYTLPALEDDYTVVIKPVQSEADWENYCLKQGISQDWILIPYLQPMAEPIEDPVRKPKKPKVSKAKPLTIVAETSSEDFLDTL